MSFLESLLLGFIQGVAEFLPISSSGHLAIFQNVFGLQELENNILFDVLLHLATLISVFIAYWKDIKGIILEFAAMVHLRKLPEGTSPDMTSRRMIWFIIIGTLPLLVAILFKDHVENLMHNLFFIAGALVVTGTMLFLCDKFGHGTKQAKDATLLDALLVGVGQMIAIVPGLSRSGTTIASGLGRGFDRSFAVKFSFLLSIPAIIGANILTIFDVIAVGIDWNLLPMYLAGMVTAAVCGYFSIRLLNKIASGNSFGGFSYYCWGAGIVTFFLAMIS